jgi:glycosyltransferase involved in cell wall biosynthesis
VYGFTSVIKTGEIDGWMPVNRSNPGNINEWFRVSRDLAKSCDIVHLHGASRLFSTETELISRISGTPVVLTLHGGGTIDLPEYEFSTRMWHNVTRRATMQLADRIVSPCDLFTDIANRYVSKSKIRNIPVDVNTEFFEPGKRTSESLPVLENLNANANIIVSVNMIKPLKGMQYVIQSLSQILEEHQNSHYLIVGDGEYQSTLESIAQQQRVEDNVHFVGATSDMHRIRDYLRAADMAAIPSSGEACPIAALEALATGCPVVASPVGGLGEIIGDNERGRTAEIFPTGSYSRTAPDTLPDEKLENLADEISWVLSHPEKASSLAQAGRKFVVENYDTSVIVQQLEDVYAELI